MIDLMNPILVNSLILDPFAEFIHSVISKNEKTFVLKRSIKMDVRPEFIQLFKNSTMIASKY